MVRLNTRTAADTMPAMPFGNMTANFDHVRRKRIEKEKDRIRSEMSELETLVTGWEQEAQDRNDDIPTVVAVRAMEHERNRLLDELEPLHTDVIKAIGTLTSEQATWYRGIMKRVVGWIPDRRDDPAELRNRAIAIVDKAISGSHPEPHELATILQALKLIQ